VADESRHAAVRNHGVNASFPHLFSSRYTIIGRVDGISFVLQLSFHEGSVTSIVVNDEYSLSISVHRAPCSCTRFVSPRPISTARC
jgi:hypothetical protein